MHKRLMLVVQQAIMLTLIASAGEKPNVMAAQSSIDIPTIESNLVVVAVGYRKTLLSVNGIDVPVFQANTNELGITDTGVLFCIVSPSHFAGTFFVLGRDTADGDLSLLTPSYHRFSTGKFYRIPYSIRDLGYGQGTNMYFHGGGVLSLPTTHANASYLVTSAATSNLKTAGNCFRTYAERFYISAEEARSELDRLRVEFVQYEAIYNATSDGIKKELERRKNMGVVTKEVDLLDETDAFSLHKREQIRIVPLYFGTKREIENAERQLAVYEMERK